MWPGQQFDAEIAFAYSRYRFYSHELGRFISPDPIGLQAAPHLYAYPNNPLIEFDPFGLSTWTDVHNAYLQYVRPGAKSHTFRPAWASGRSGTRIADDFDRATRTLFEANTTPWSRMDQRQLARKLDQVAADFELLRTGQVSRVIWFGTEPLPREGRGGKLRRAIEVAGIEYYHIPPPNSGCS